MNKFRETQICNLVGLAQKSRKLITGEAEIEKAVRKETVKLILLAADSSKSTQKRYMDLSTYYQLECYMIFSKEVLGHCIGKNYRAAIAICDAGFAKALKKLIVIKCKN